MIKFASISHSDSVFLSTVAVARVLRTAGHEFRIALDESASSFVLLKRLAEQLDEDLVPLDVLINEPPDAVLFASSFIAPHAFKDVFRINFLPGVFLLQMHGFLRMNLFALGNYVFSPNYLDQEIQDVYGGCIPTLGVPGADLYPLAQERNIIFFPDSFPVSKEGRRKWFAILEDIARANPQYELIIKERFAGNFIGHFDFPSFKDFFTENTPASIRIASYEEDTRNLVSTASYIIGVFSSIFVEAALNHKKVCLINTDFGEYVLGRPVGDYWTRTQGLQVTPDEAAMSLHESCLLTPESLFDFVPASFDAEWFVKSLEGIFEYFPDPELRNAMKFDLDKNRPLDEQLDVYRKNAGSPKEERLKNLIRYEYAVCVTNGSAMINLFNPEISIKEMSQLIRTYIKFDRPCVSIEQARSDLQFKIKKLAAFVAEEFYDLGSIDALCRPGNISESNFLVMALYVSDALKNAGRLKEATILGDRVFNELAERKDNSGAMYSNAVNLKRSGFVNYAIILFNKLIQSSEVEKTYKSGAFYHLGDVSINAGEFGKALLMYKKCLEIEPNHGKAKEMLDICLNKVLM